jgi:hypothetical protein
VVRAKPFGSLLLAIQKLKTKLLETPDYHRIDQGLYGGVIKLCNNFPGRPFRGLKSLPHGM